MKIQGTCQAEWARIQVGPPHARNCSIASGCCAMLPSLAHGYCIKYGVIWEIQGRCTGCWPAEIHQSLPHHTVCLVLAAPLSAGQLMAQLLSISRTANSLSGCETGSAWTDPNRMIIAVYLQLIGALQLCLLALPIYVSVKKIQHGRLHGHTGIQTSWHPSVPRSSSLVAAFKYDR